MNDLLQLGEPVDSRVPWIRTLHALDDAWDVSTPGPRLESLRKAGRQLGDSLRSGARVVAVKTLNNATLPYPTRFAFNGAVPLPWPLVIMVHRTLLVQLETSEGAKNVLFNPTDAEHSRNAPFFRKLAERLERVAPWAERLISKPFDSLEQQLGALGVTPEDIDLIAFDHFHTQDLRPILGSGNGHVGRFPNALLLAPRPEWDDWDGLHPLQKPWFIEDGKQGVPAERVIITDNDLQLGGGCLLLRTPGHTTGNQTLMVHGDQGVFGCSENGCSADNWSPRASRIPGLKKFVDLYDFEVVLNANTPELAATQYTSMVLERSVVDRVPDNEDFVQMFPSSEVTATALAPRIKPGMVFGHRDSGRFARV